MYPHDHVTLESILPRLPVEAVSWINSLSPGWRASVENRLHIVGPDSFVAYWRTYRDELAFEMAFDLTED
jgi:hypothetical protein